MQVEDKVVIVKSKLRTKLKVFKNKYVFTLTLFSFFALFLDEYDIFTLISLKSKLNKIEADQNSVEIKLKETKNTLSALKYSAALEKYAREQKLFKKDDEDIFVLSYE